MIRVNDQELDYEPGLTVRRLLEREGLASSMVALWIGDQMVRRAEYDATLVPDEADVKIVLMAAGG